MERRRFITLLGTVALAGPAQGRKKMVEKKVAFLYDGIYLKHRTPEWHPETPKRLTAIYEGLKRSVFYGDLLLLKPREAAAEDLILVHDEAYIRRVEEECRRGSSSLSTGDTDIGLESYKVACYAAGGVLAAIDNVMAEETKRAFCAIRPPGHHASPGRGMGFCIFNNVAIAARYAQKKFGAERILIADWDVHHGNGTQDTFYSDGSVFFFSTHQWPLYPGTGKASETGEGKGKGCIMNRPFPAGAGNREIIGAFRNDLLPAARKFKPDLTLISAGFDSRVNDPLGAFRVDDEGFRELTRVLIEVSEITGKGRLVSVLEGGYNLEGLAAACSAHVEELVMH